MQILFDENMPAAAAARLRRQGHDVLEVSNAAPSDEDEGVLTLATREERVLATFDTDFGDLVHSRGLPAPYGIVLFRLHRVLSEEAQASFIVANLTSQERWDGLFTAINIRQSVVNESRIFA